MAITDVRELRSFEYSETLGDKGRITLAGSVDLLALHNSTPDFGTLADDSTSWTNLGNATIPKVGETRLVAGVLFTVKSRKMAYYKGDDADRAVKITVAYEAQDEESEQPEPEDQEAETWKRISISTEQKECPLTDEGADGTLGGQPAKNSAGDPLDGLTENRCLQRLTYTNTKVRSPNFASLTAYVNTTNDREFLGAARRTLLCLGYNADYDDKFGLWNVNVEWLYDPEQHVVKVWDAGFNQLVDGQRRAILDQANNPVSKPVPLNGSGVALPADLLVSESFANQYMQKRTFYPYKEKNHANIFNEGGI
jgi:hypothetical protein